MTHISLMEDLTGRTLGRYDIVSPIGEGGMAAVYKAYQPDMERYVALKVLPPQFAKDKQFVSRFKLEARALAKLQHPHILPIYDYGTADGYIYLVMPFVEGGDLAQLMRRGRQPLSRVVKIITQIGEALDYAHAKEIVHRDIKPSNVLINQQGYCLLSDFGLAKVAEQSKTKLTASGLVVGTPEYMSPEQGLGKKIDYRTDIYALGIILFELLTGRTPFKAETWTAVIMKAINEPLPLPSSLNPAIPLPVEQVILKACAKEPEQRYSTVHEMSRALETAVAESATFSVETHEEESALTSLRQRLLAETQAVPDQADSLPETVFPVSPSPSSQAEPSAASSTSNSVVLPAIAIPKWFMGLVVILLLGVIGLGIFAFMQREDPSGQQPLPPTIAPAIIEPEQEAPPPTELPSPSPMPTEPPPPTAVPVQPTPLPPPAGNNASTNDGPPPPPQEAIDACRGLAPANACSFTDARGNNVNGSCRTLSEELACTPNNAPQPRP